MRTTLQILAALFLAASAHAELTLYYVRHGQGGHNVKAYYEEAKIPKQDWPAWVGDENHFTPLGQYQVQALATNLLPFKFDLIAASPVWRARNTILPYLKLTGQQAEIWPELAETAMVGDTAAARAGKFDPAVFQGVKDIVLPDEEKPYFHFRAGAPAMRFLAITNAPQAAAVALKVEDLLRARFGTNDATVLLVGHGTAGLTLVRTLARDKNIGPHHMDNTRLWGLKRQADGTYKLLFHDKSAVKVAPKPAAPPL